MSAESAVPEPASERSRLKALRSYEVLDTEAELAFDDLAELAARFCDAPIAMITLIDETRMWCKATFGIDGIEAAREDTLCNWAIRQDEPLVVADASRDERFRRSPLVAGEPGIRFYAGAPLTTSAGLRLGSLCVIDRQPRSLTAVQVGDLRVLARAVVGELERRRLEILRARYPERAQPGSEVMPICAGCKKIRDREGRWNEVDLYLDRHFGCSVTHTYCEACEGDLYPA